MILWSSVTMPAEADSRAPACRALAEGVEPRVQLCGIGRRYSKDLQALACVDLVISAGEHVAVVGASGSGKSSLLNVLGLLDRPTDGMYLLDGVETTRMTERERARVRAHRLAFVFQSFHLIPHRTVLENVMLAQLYMRVPRRDRERRAEDALGRVGMQHRMSFQPRTLSGGEAQRVAIARALVTEPALMLCDEPTGNLDSRTATAVLDVFDELHDAGLTLVVVTHDKRVSERAERMVIVRDGRVVGDAPSF